MIFGPLRKAGTWVLKAGGGRPKTDMGSGIRGVEDRRQGAEIYT